MKFLETPSGYRGFVEEDFKYYKDVLDLEEKYGNIDVLTFVVKPEKGNIFQKDVLSLIHELTEISWQTPYSSRVSSITNHQYTTVDGDDISISDFVDNVDSLSTNEIANLYNAENKAKKTKLQGSYWTGQIAHLGIGIFAIGLIMNVSQSYSNELIISSGDTIQFGNQEFIILNPNEVQKNEKNVINLPIQKNNSTKNASLNIFKNSTQQAHPLYSEM